MKNSFAKNIKALRTEEGCTQAELGKLLNVTQRKVSYWENGSVEPDLDTLCQLADFFRVTVDELIGHENE
ncbi:MAG: helix-turn-helix domain-containing protein [Clostridiales bacterium]|nr:helix-turn-helix domain-containing protein [Clostridiales bacterium]